MFGRLRLRNADLRMCRSNMVPDGTARGRPPRGSASGIAAGALNEEDGAAEASYQVRPCCRTRPGRSGTHTEQISGGRSTFGSPS